MWNQPDSSSKCEGSEIGKSVSILGLKFTKNINYFHVIQWELPCTESKEAWFYMTEHAPNFKMSDSVFESDSRPLEEIIKKRLLYDRMI